MIASFQHRWVLSVRAAAGGVARCGVFGLTFGSAYAAPVLSYKTQERSYTSWIGSGPVTFETNSSDFNAFSGWTRLDFPNPNGQPDSTAYSSQNSVLSPDGIKISGTVWGVDGNFGPGGSGGGTSLLNVSFTVGERTLFSLDGTFSSALESAAADYYVSLSTDDAVLVQWEAHASYANTYRGLGALNPGVYRLVVNVRDGWMGPGAGSGYCHFDVSFAVYQVEKMLILSSGGEPRLISPGFMPGFAARRNDGGLWSVAMLFPPLVPRRRPALA